MSRRRFLIPTVVVLVLVAVGVGWWLVSTRRPPYHAPPPAFDGTSGQLTQTVIVPTLDTPIPDGKSAVWCASFQLAWNRLRDDVAKGPVRLAGAQPVADRLNRGDQTEADIDPADVYAAAGLTGDGIADRIRTEMARRFPNVPPPDLGTGNAAVAYSYLAVSSEFDYPFFDNDGPLEFVDTAGRKTPVGSFGVRWKDDFAYNRLRAQVHILYTPPDRMHDPLGMSEFILDPCRTTRPYQIVIARVDRKPTLAETVADVRQKIAVGRNAEPRESRLGPNDVMLIPNISFRVSHRFREVEGKPVENPPLSGLPIETAMQTVQFRLDRSGVELKAESKIQFKPMPRVFLANRPFLVYLAKRDGGNPFFAMWVENAELLERR
jgi:hypothetical protein